MHRPYLNAVGTVLPKAEIFFDKVLVLIITHLVVYLPRPGYTVSAISRFSDPRRDFAFSRRYPTWPCLRLVTMPAFTRIAEW
jgi:hypothetical protein